MRLYVGYDPREDMAFRVLKHTVRKQCGDGATEVVPLLHRDLRAAGIFNRTWHVDPEGQYWDERDGKPFSTEFSHSRFAVPILARNAGLGGWCGFVDVDFMFLDCPRKMLADLDADKAVYVVKHQWDAVKEGRKMDGVVQQRYRRKLWSSLILWNINHPSNDWLTPYRLNNAPGGDLHAFCWLQDEEIGSLDPGWNWIPGFSNDHVEARAVHFSFGGPWMPGYEGVEFAGRWRTELQEVVDQAHAEREAERGLFR